MIYGETSAQLIVMNPLILRLRNTFAYTEHWVILVYGRLALGMSTMLGTNHERVKI